MGSLFTPKVSAPPPPPEPKDFNVEDRINGTKQTVVKQPDGSKTIVIERDLTPEQQEIEDNLKQISEEALSKFETLTNDPFLESIPEFKDQINNIFNRRAFALNDAFQDFQSQTEKGLARFGIEEGTTANNLRAQGTRDFANEKAGLEDDKLNTLNSVRQQEMANQLNLFGVASGRQDTLLNNAVTTLGLGNQIALANAARSDAFNNQLFQNNLAFTNQQNAARAQGQATFGQIVGTAVGAGIGGAFGGGAGGFTATGTSKGRAMQFQPFSPFTITG